MALLVSMWNLEFSLCVCFVAFRFRFKSHLPHSVVVVIMVVSSQEHELMLLSV